MAPLVIRSAYESVGRRRSGGDAGSHPFESVEVASRWRCRKTLVSSRWQGESAKGPVKTQRVVLLKDVPVLA